MDVVNHRQMTTSKRPLFPFALMLATRWPIFVALDGKYWSHSYFLSASTKQPCCSCSRQHRLVNSLPARCSHSVMDYDGLSGTSPTSSTRTRHHRPGSTPEVCAEQCAHKSFQDACGGGSWNDEVGACAAEILALTELLFARYCDWHTRSVFS